MTKFLVAGNVPIVAVAILAACGFWMGDFYGRGTAMREADALPHVAIAEKGAVVLEAALARPGASPEILNREVAQPLIAVLQKYADQGLLVIDVSKDELGNMSVAALPPQTVDVTQEMRRAVHLVPASTARAIAPAGAASAILSNAKRAAS